MKKVVSGLFLCVAVGLFISGCGILNPAAEKGEGFEWEYLFEDNDEGAPRQESKDADDNPAASSAESAIRRESAAYRLQFDDTVIISLMGIREFQNNIEDRVDEEGEISLPYLDEIQAEGKTSAELEKDIQKAYIEGGIYKSLNIKVVIPNQSFYYVRGEVKRPGRYPWKSGTTLLQAISSAAGTTEYASDKVYLTRSGNVEKYDIGDIEDNPSIDVVLKPDDQIRVKRSIF